MDKQLLDQFIKDYENADMVLIGIGKRIHESAVDDYDKLQKLMHFYKEKLDKKNYFIITTLQKDGFLDEGYNRRRLVRPLLIQEDSEEEKQWELYNKWLSATLNKKLMIIELGEDFNRPNIFRWPFEKIVFINQKACMYRVNDVFYQLPENICDRAIGVQVSPYEFIKELSVLLNEL